jgi:hypothetical protein
MTKTQYLLVKVAEESAEIGQMALKCTHFGILEKQDPNGATNIERLRNEITDLRAVIEMLEKEVWYGLYSLPEETEAKIAKVTHYMKYSQSQGLVDADE